MPATVKSPPDRPGRTSGCEISPRRRAALMSRRREEERKARSGAGELRPMTATATPASTPSPSLLPRSRDAAASYSCNPREDPMQYFRVTLGH